MYHHLSRVLYRRLAPMLSDDPLQGGIARQRQRLLDACEATLKRLATDPDYFAHPARFLFSEIRCLFSLEDQRRVRLIVDADVRTAGELLERRRALEPRGCAAFNRGGKPCRREALTGGRYCPSHKHLEESFGARPTQQAVSLA